MNPKMRAHEILNLQEKLSHLEKECRLVSALSYLTEITHLTNSEARNPSTHPMTKSAGCVLVSFKDSVIGLDQPQTVDPKFQTKHILV